MSKNKSVEELLKVYVESEIVNYNYHKYLISKYEQNKSKAFSDMNILPSTTTAGSVIKMPEKNYNSQEAMNKQLGLYIDELDEKIAIEQVKLDQVDTWLKSCCSNGRQERMIRLYMIRNQCTEIEKVSSEVEYSIINIMKTKERVINRIISKFFTESV